ncbi:protein kinase [Vitiosangium sp. GDMCC 1.1324]|uniref:protein kinase domain-containing protein n=1 Tax=Vitiosangium sp. (strain GDMCC 1.1324) TaxID=2138576 RepID=UPI000D33E823|nr:protein kinase [Vitiosangium sp. GDMCC 1.1324]PTL82790.1 protein kinase [Vitiosangium sp. GDMCC 1.1324]
MQEGDESDGWPQGGKSRPPEESQLETALRGQEDSDFGDSFLKEVVRGPVVVRRPFPGERLGGWDGRRFEFLQELGAGGMGWVARAWDAQLQRVVALKFLLPRQELAELALREARVIARLDHENIIRIFDVSEWRRPPGEPRIPFLVMEFLDGESLAQAMRRERPGLRHTLEIMSAVAAGLAHAHEHHIVHGDLKPSNVFVTHKGVVKLLDFGLARFIDPSTSSIPNLPMAGTPPYMAPEQWRGEALDEHTDIWAAGVMLYEMLTGALPYPSTSLEELRAKVLSPEPVPLLREHHPELPWALESLLAVALAKEPSKRLLSASELQEELRELEEYLRPGHRPARALAPQRRQVTLVSCRLEGLVHLARQLDPEDFGECEAAFHRSFSKVIHQHGGFVTLCMGNEALACFGYPVTREGDSERAVHAGLLLASSVLQALQERLPQESLSSLAVKVGIHTDMVVLDGFSQEVRGSTPSIQGEAPKVATWLASQAGLGEVVLSQETHTLVHRAFETRLLGARALEGARSVRVFRVVGARQTVSRFDRTLAASGSLSPLVGRERELGELLAYWEVSRRGNGGFVLLSGEAGIGKSRLIQELLERVPQAHALQLRLQCWSQFSTSAFHPIIELVQRLFVSPKRSPQENLRMLEARLVRWELKQVQVHLLASLLSLPVAETSPHRRLTPEREMEEVLEALELLLLRTSQVRPVLLVVEDLHWADPSTLKLLGSLSERVERAPILGVLSARPEFRPPWPPRPDFHPLVLERLTAPCTLRLVKEVARGRTLPEPVLEQLVARTDGVPLFVEEMTHALLEGGSVVPIPTTLQELLLARLDSLPRRQKELAQLCAVVGRSFTRQLLSRLTRMSEASLRRDLLGLVTAGLLQRNEESTGIGYQFRHALIQEAAYQSLPRTARRQHHQRIAQTLVEHFPDVVESRPELLAHHYTEAGEPQPAISAWMKAGLRASQSYANQEAVSHLTQALKLLRGLLPTPERSQEELELLLALGLPLVQLQGYRSPEVERTYIRVLELLREGGDVLSQLKLPYWGAFAYFFTQKKYQEAHGVAEFLVLLGERQHCADLLSLGHRMMATDFFTWGHMPVARQHIELALAHSGDGRELARHRMLAVKYWINPRAMALAFSSVIRSVLHEPGLARQQAREAVELAGKLGHPHTCAGVLTYAAIGAQIRREARSTLEWTEPCLALAREHRFRLWLWWSTILKSWALAWLGRAEEGLDLMLVALSEWERSGVLIGTPHNFGMLADIYLKLGRAEEGLVAVQRALAPTQLPAGERAWEADLHLIRGQLLLLRDRDAEAREEFLVALQVARRQGARLYESWAQARLAGQSEGLGLPPDGLSPHSGTMHPLGQGDEPLP